MDKIFYILYIMIWISLGGLLSIIYIDFSSIIAISLGSCVLAIALYLTHDKIKEETK